MVQNRRGQAGGEVWRAFPSRVAPAVVRLTRRITTGPVPEGEKGELSGWRVDSQNARRIRAEVSGDSNAAAVEEVVVVEDGCGRKDMREW